jgi:hypothetical protein
MRTVPATPRLSPSIPFLLRHRARRRGPCHPQSSLLPAPLTLPRGPRHRHCPGRRTTPAVIKSVLRHRSHPPYITFYPVPHLSPTSTFAQSSRPQPAPPSRTSRPWTAPPSRVQRVAHGGSVEALAWTVSMAHWACKEGIPKQPVFAACRAPGAHVRVNARFIPVCGGCGPWRRPGPAGPGRRVVTLRRSGRHARTT